MGLAARIFFDGLPDVCPRGFIAAGNAAAFAAFFNSGPGGPGETIDMHRRPAACYSGAHDPPTAAGGCCSLAHGSRRGGGGSGGLSLNVSFFESVMVSHFHPPDKP